MSRIKLNLTNEDNESTAVNVDEQEMKLQKYVESLTEQIAKLSRPESEPEIETIGLSDSDDGATAHSISNREHEAIPIMNEAIDTKPKQILIHTWFKNDVSVKDISNKKQKILEVHMPINNEQLVNKFLKEYVDLKHKYYIYFEAPEFRKTFSNVVTKLYKKGTQNLVECTERIVNVTDEEDMKELVKKYHESKTWSQRHK